MYYEISKKWNFRKGVGKMVNYNFESYGNFCQENGLKPGYLSSLNKFESLCQKLGIETRPKKSLGVAK